MRPVVAVMAAGLLACVPIDRTPVETSAPFRDALAQTDRIDAPSPGPLTAGAARQVMTPAGTPPLAGYGNRRGRPSEGVHDPLYARALALRTGDRLVVLVALDLLAVTDDMTAAVEALVRRERPLPAGALVLTATHTHSGFGAVARRVWESVAAGEYDGAMFDWLTGRAAAAALAAMREMQPVELAWGEAQAPERILNRMVRGGVTDPAVPFLIVRRADRSPLAYLVNFAAHPTVLKADNFLLSADFPGATSRALEQSGAVALYTAGAVADQTADPPHAPDRFQAAEAMGRDLAARVAAAVAALPPSAWRSHAPLAAWRLELPLPAAQVKTSPHRRVPRAIADLFFDRRTTLAVAVIGDGVLIGVPCDLSAEIGLAWKAESQQLGRRAVVLGFTNDYVGYVIPNRYYETAHYEATMSFNGPYMDRYFSAIVLRVLSRLGPAAEQAA